MKKCYIAGKIGDLPKETYTANFKQAEKAVINLGYHPISPLNLHNDCTHEHNWISFMRCDLKAFLVCDAVYACENWIISPGAKIEVELAFKLGLEIIFQKPLQRNYLVK